MNRIAEEWRTVPGFQKYEVSNRGSVRSIDRVVTARNRWGQLVERNYKGKPIQPISHHGYLVVNLVEGSRRKRAGVHQLVAWAWIGEPGELVVNHINGVKHDNRPENLEYVTNSENVFHAHRTGLMSGVGAKVSLAMRTRKRHANGRLI